MKIKVCGIAVLCGLTAACAPLGNSRLEQRVEQQDQQLRQIQPQQADTWNEVQAMRQEINQLKGQLAELNNAGGARALAERVRQHDQALRQVDDNMALNLPLGSPIPAQPAPAGPQEPVTGITPTGAAPDSSAYGQGIVQAQEAGSYGLPSEPQPVAVNAPTEATWGKADPKPEQQPEKPKDIAQALFEAGVNDYNARNYAASERSFKDFLKNYPNNARAAEAQYYLGECLFSRNQYPQAALEYDVVIKKFPKSSSAPSAYLKQGICFGKMKQPEAARMQMQAVISKYPSSPEAARAKAFLKTNK